MQASVRKYKIDPAQMDEVARRVEEKFVSRVSQLPGFGAYHFVEVGNGILITVTVCDDPEAVAQSADLAAEFVGDELSDVEIERVEAATGEVTVSRTA
ncbi:MAG TPA: hypothetical protein VKG89_04605 [Solirubrobacterales bacterium]|nr:hypothetical protein [Solirubrobacterales bacterium]